MSVSPAADDELKCLCDNRFDSEAYPLVVDTGIHVYTQAVRAKTKPNF